MLLTQTDKRITNGIASGLVHSRYKSAKNAKGLLVTRCSLSCNYDSYDSTYQEITLVAYGEEAFRVIKYAYENKAIIIAFGRLMPNKIRTDRTGETQYSLFTNTLISPQMILEIFTWHKNSMQIDKILSENYEGKIRYDYSEEQKEEDHRI